MSKNIPSSDVDSDRSFYRGKRLKDKKFILLSSLYLQSNLIVTMGKPDPKVVRRCSAVVSFGSEDWCSNTCFEGNSLAPPSFIDYETLQSQKIPSDWGSEACAKRAAIPTESLAKLMGQFSIDVSATPDDVKDLCKALNVADSTFNDDGEYSTAFGQIPLSRLIDMEYRNRIKIVDSCKKETLNFLMTLQSPNSSRWKKPFIRVISNHTYHRHSSILTVKLYIYFTRLIFELIADDTIKHIVARLEDKPFEVKGLYKRPQQPVQFTTTPLENPTQRFSLSGLLKRSENKGYTLANAQPKGLHVQLYDFQLSTYQWMLDQENISSGLNSFFWEEWVVRRTLATMVT